jgi:hypothetical protein
VSAAHAWILSVDDHPSRRGDVAATIAGPREAEMPPVMALAGSNGPVSSTRFRGLESVRAKMPSVRRKLLVNDRLHAATNFPRRGFIEARPPGGVLRALDP